MKIKRIEHIAIAVKNMAPLKALLEGQLGIPMEYEEHLPEHATSVRAFRQVLGGPVVLAGTSAMGTVSYVAASPLTPGASYTVWLTGHNSEGDGPQSQVFTFTA